MTNVLLQIADGTSTHPKKTDECIGGHGVDLKQKKRPEGHFLRRETNLSP